MLLGGGYVAQALAFFSALTVAPAGLVSLLLYTYPALVTAAAALLWRERVGRVRVIAIAAALVGTALTIGPVRAGGTAGVVLGLLSAVAYSSYILAGSRIATRIGPLARSTVVVTTAAVVYVAVALVTTPSWPASSRGWAAVAGMALICTVIAVLAFFAGLAIVGPADASTLSTVEPVVTLVLAVAVLGERIAAPQLAGALLVLGAVVVLSRAAPAAPPTP